MKDETLPDGFLCVSDAVTQLAQGIWGGRPQAEPVRTIKGIAKKASIGFGPWQEQENASQLRPGTAKWPSS